MRRVYPIPSVVGMRATPVDTLVALCERYGLDVTVNGVTTRVVLGREEVGDLATIVTRVREEATSNAPPGHMFSLVSRYVDVPGGARFDLFFALDETALENDLVH